MTKKYFEQETNVSCGPSAIRNVMKQFGITISEKLIRQECRTDKNGTNESNLIKCIKKRGLQFQEYSTSSERRFRKILISGLKQGNKFILNADNFQHWIAAVKYEKRRFKIIDTVYKEETGKIAPLLTFSELKKLSLSFSRSEGKQYYYFIEIMAL